MFLTLSPCSSSYNSTLERLPRICTYISAAILFEMILTGYQYSHWCSIFLILSFSFWYHFYMMVGEPQLI